MYTPSVIGPWPIIDIAASKVSRSSGATPTLHGNKLNVCLDTANLGGNTEAFINGRYAISWTASAAEWLSFGVCLTPIENVHNGANPLYLDLCMGVYCYESSGVRGNVIPWVGFIDSAAAALSNGWDATNNAVTNYNILPHSGDTPGLYFKEQILLKSITSAELDTDKYLCAGFSLTGYTAGDIFDDINYTISARYATNSISTYMKS